ncbi:TPA: hypothetical protein IAB95_00630, partial [Candidatus Ventrenecus avicola]|nr:hypothetical protein [Candidatus Ventrenecus avicola]
VDTTNPTVTISASVSGNAITVQATGSDAHSGIASYQYSRDNSTWYTGTSGTYNFTGLSYGNYIIYVKVIDYSGRVSNIVEMPVNVSIDAVSLIQSLANNGQLMYDGTADNNLRYVGANPNNYINFNNELWRIVGVMNNINDGYGSINSRIKIVRDTPIGNLNWDSSISTINNGYGVNEWSQADLMLLLNTGAYWNRTSGNCYVGINNMVTTCDYTTQGLTTEAKKYIGTTLWNVGANGGTYGWNNVSASNFYMLERGSYTGKQCSATPSCNDNVSRTVTWLGKIGLIYPSDYAYATSGGATTSRNSCLNMVMYDWKNFNDCYQNNWLNLEQRNPVLWTLMPLGVDNGSQQVYITADGGISTSTTGVVQEVLPTLYLTPGVRVASGDGSETNPYVLTL